MSAVLPGMRLNRHKTPDAPPAIRVRTLRIHPAPALRRRAPQRVQSAACDPLTGMPYPVPALGRSSSRPRHRNHTRTEKYALMCDLPGVGARSGILDTDRPQTGSDTGPDSPRPVPEDSASPCHFPNFVSLPCHFLDFMSVAGPASTFPQLTDTHLARTPSGGPEDYDKNTRICSDRTLETAGQGYAQLTQRAGTYI
jgi:hypothetical protein